MGVETAFHGDVPLLFGAAAALLCAVAVWQYFALRTRVARAPAILLTALRVAALALVLLIITGPQVVRRTLQHVRRPIAVAVDTSRSMSLRGGLDRTRLERVQDFLDSGEFRRFAGDYLPKYFSVADGATEIPGTAVAGLAAAGVRTDLDGAIDGIARQMPEDLALTILYSDGGHLVPARTGPPAAAGTLIVVGVGQGERIRDIEIRDLLVPGLAFAGQPLPLQVNVRASGYAGKEVPLLLKRGKQVLLSKTIRLPRDGVVLTEQLEWVPQTAAHHPLTVQIPLQDGEQIEDNNRRDFSVMVVRDKIRVLLVSGSPTWNYRFLRGALKGDPTIDLVSFIILRTAADAVDVPQQELSLIPFPTQKIFLEELPNFDLLIFDNFAFQPYLPMGYLDRVHDFVRAGGGFWMLGGSLSFSGVGYGSTAIGKILPLELGDGPEGPHEFRNEPIRARLTAAGRNHPFFKGIGTTGENLPPLVGLNLCGPPREGAVVLAEAVLPTGARQPLIAIGRYGQGRVLAVLTDSLWKWAFEEVGRGRGNRAYLSLIRQAVRWSVGDPQLQPVRVEPERNRLVPGERLRARIHVLSEDFLPAKSADLAVILRDPGGATRALPASPEAPGAYRVEADIAEAGTWEITAVAALRGVPYGRAAATVTAVWPEAEFQDPQMNREAVTALLSGRRGAFVELADPGATVKALEKVLRELPEAEPGTRAESRGLGEEPGMFLVFLGLVGAEWIIRRRSGLD